MIKNILANFNISEREKTTLPIVAIMLVVAAVIRTQPHISNITPFFAISILAGFILGPKRAGLAGLLSVVAMFVGDLIIGLHWTMLFVYAGIAIAALTAAMASDFIRSRKSWLSRAGAAFLTSAVASTVFFLISNLGVWLVGVDSGLALYPMTLAGLLTCFDMAIPFFTKSLSSDLFFGTSFVLLSMRLMAPYNVPMAVKTNGR